MKKLHALLPILAALLVPGKASAQMLPDSTVQIVAYWEVGDQITYRAETKAYDIDAEGNETQASASSELMHFKVVDATDSTYTMEVTYEILSDPDLERFISPEEMNAHFNTPYRFKTDELGSFLRLENLDEIVEATQGLRPYFKKGVLKELDAIPGKDEIASETLEKLVDGSVDAIMLALSPEVLECSFVSELSSLLFYHGCKLDATATYSYTQNLADVLDGVLDGIDGEAEGVFWVNSKYTDENAAMIVSQLEAGTEQLEPVLKQYLEPMISAIADRLEVASEEEIQAAIAEACKQASLEISQNSAELIHLGTGWPISVASDCYVLCKFMDQEENKHVIRSIQYVDPNE